MVLERMQAVKNSRTANEGKVGEIGEREVSRYAVSICVVAAKTLGKRRGGDVVLIDGQSRCNRVGNDHPV